MKKSRILLESLALFFLLLFSFRVSAADNPDAIAVRIVPNLNHYSISRWYESQGFQGSPQAVMVDGYEGIRDGRTVYVNAANINPVSNSIYTNVYLISYNQAAAPNTVDILGQIISHWKFNDNLPKNPASCSITSLGCAADSDCPTGATCATSGLASSSCVLTTPKTCLADSDCPTNFFCDSLKAKVARDLKRIGRQQEIKEALANYKTSTGHFPSLSAGSFVSGRSVSVWPSWQQEFLSALALPAGSVDPINRIGSCPGYDPKTCWNPDTKQFNGQSFSSGQLVLPSGSFVLSYSSDLDSLHYNLCSVLESRSNSLNYHFVPNDPADSACTTGGIGAAAGIANTPPQLVNKSMQGQTNAEFVGYLQVADQQNGNLTWSLDGGSFPGWVGGPILQDTANPTQKKVYAQKAGPTGTYSLRLTVTDSQGASSVVAVPVIIGNAAIDIDAQNAEYIANPVTPFSYSIRYSALDLRSFSFTKVSGPAGLDLFSAPTMVGLTSSSVISGANRYQADYNGIISTSTVIARDLDFVYKIQITNSASKLVTKNISIKVRPEFPTLDLNCPASTRATVPGLPGTAYSCLLGPWQQGNHTLSYSASGLPAGISVSGQTISGTASVIGTFNINVQAINEYGASTTKSFVLKTDSYCGDGILETPNTEGRGGYRNDGFEDCDGTMGVATSSASSNISRQYGCSTTSGSARPYPINSTDQCVFLTPAKGGGYCGDGYCQKLSATIDETFSCPQDCRPAPGDCKPNCTGRSCGGDGCGGTCGLCAGNQTCTKSGNCVSSKCAKKEDCEDYNECTDDACLTADNIGTCSNTLITTKASSCAFYYGDTEKATGNCLVTGTKTCKNVGTGGFAVYNYGACDNASDPRDSYCADKCEGENFEINSDCQGTCIGTGHGNACLKDKTGNRIQELSCSTLLKRSYFSGSAVCNSNCTGYSTANCKPEMCLSKQDKNCWYMVPASEDKMLKNGTPCMVRMYVGPDNVFICDNQTVSQADIDAGAAAAKKWDWFVGKLVDMGTNGCTINMPATQPENWICAVSFTDSNKVTHTCGSADQSYNPLKCRWQSVEDCNQLWTNYCFVANE